MTREHDTGFYGFELSIIMLTRVTSLVCLFVPHVWKTVGSSVGLAKFDTTHEHDTSFCGFGLSI